MSEITIASLLRPGNRFLRSTDLVRDFTDPAALNGYHLTDFGKQCLSRIAEGLAEGSSARAWRLTGDYGSGKSSFALLLAAALVENQRLPKRLQQEVLAATPEVHSSRYVPLLVAGSREAMSVSIIRALLETNRKNFPKGARSSLEERLERYSRSDSAIADHIVIQLIADFTAKLIAQGKGSGLLLILDEMGKFLEFAALNPDKQDVFLLQKLGEYASRSGSEPFILVCLLHQGFNAYADSLTASAKREWEKVAGRLEEIRFQQPLDQIVLLLASALNADTERIDGRFLRATRASMDTAIRLGWFGASSS
jgi:hypothetical protein